MSDLTGTDGQRRWLESLPRATLSVEGFLDGPLPPKVMTVSVEVPDGRWQGFKFRNAKRFPVRWLVRLRPVRMKLLKRFEGEVQAWPGGEITVREAS